MVTQAAVSILIGAQLGGSFNGAFSGAQKQLSTLGNSIKHLNTQSANIKAYRSLQKETLQASKAWKSAQSTVKHLADEITRADKPSKALQNSFRKAQQTANLAKNAYTQNKSALRELGASMQNAGINTRHLTAEQNKLGKALENLEKRQRSVAKLQTMKSQNMSKRAEYRGQMIDAAALGASLYTAVRPAIDFEFAMSKVGAITNESIESKGFKKLTELSRELGRSTQYTASEAAEAMQYLGMAGFNTQQILATTPAALNLAIAGNMDLGRTADIASNILTGFNMKAEETAHVADVLAQTSRSTNVNVEMLGETMKYVAPAAAAVGGSLEETAALAGVLGDAGIQSTMAGTMLRAAYLRLAAPAKQGAEAIREMGRELGISAENMPEVILQAGKAQKALTNMNVSIFDKNGKMRSMVDIFKDMSVALKDVSDKDKLSTVKAIFGDRAASGALAIFKHIETGRLDEVLGKVKSAEGAAQEMADRLKNTARGAWKEFLSATESVGISLGTVLLPTFSKVFRGIASVANKISAFAEHYPVWTKYIGLTIAGLISAKIAVVSLGYGFTFVKGSFFTLVRGFQIGAGIVTFAKGCFLTLIPVLKSVGLTFLGLGKTIASAFISVLKTGSSVIFAFSKSLVLTLVPMIKTVGLVVLSTIRTIGAAMLTNPIGLIITGIAIGAVVLIKYWKPISKFFKELFTPVIHVFKQVWNWVVNLWAKSKEIFEGAQEWVKNSWIGKAWRWAFDDEENTNPQAANDNKPSKIGATMREPTELNNFDNKIIRLESAKLAPTNNYPSNVNISAPITIHAAPGMNAEEVATQIERKLNEREREALRRKRAANYD